MAAVPKPIACVINTTSANTTSANVVNGSYTSSHVFENNHQENPDEKDNSVENLNEFRSALLALLTSQDPLRDAKNAIHRNIVNTLLTKEIVPLPTVTLKGFKWILDDGLDFREYHSVWVNAQNVDDAREKLIESMHLSQQSDDYDKGFLDGHGCFTKYFEDLFCQRIDNDGTHYDCDDNLSNCKHLTVVEFIRKTEPTISDEPFTHGHISCLTG